MKAYSLYSFFSHISDEVKEGRLLVIVTASFILLSFSSYLILNTEWVCRLGVEDGFFENLTALFFFVASLIFLRVFLRNRNVFFLLLAIFLFVGFGEEVSWGQRIFGYSTPGVVEKLNVQHEFSIHNLEALNSSDFDGSYKTGWARLVTINFLFLSFCLLYCVVFPVAFFFVRPVQTIVRKISLPAPPLSLGIFLVVGLLVRKLVTVYLITGDEPEQYADTAYEIYECCTSLVWFAISLYFLKTAKGPATKPVSS